ncbi:MAG: TetR/AcrR family transcriptional regulator [Phycisphaerae bacterium]
MPRVPAIRPTSAPEPAVRQRILAAARGHFFLHGFRRCTMDDLAAELGMSKKTLYACYPSKTDLLRAVILDKFQDIEKDFNRISTQAHLDFMDRLQQLLTSIQRNTEEIRPPFVRDMKLAEPELFALVEARRHTLIHHHFQQLFRAGRQAGTVRKDIPAALIIEILLGVTEAVINPPKLVELHLTPQAAFSAVLRVVLEGVLTPSGRPQS